MTTPKKLSEDFSELFHYTTVPAFESIYSGRKLWATHYEDLNDSSELLRFQRKIQEFIIPHIRTIFDRQIRRDVSLATQINGDGGVTAVVEKEATNHAKTIHQLTFGEHAFQNTFLSSFCTHHPDSNESKDGLLSQWRGYGTECGVAIVFDTGGLEKLMEDERGAFAHSLNHIGDVKYDNDDIGIQKEFHEVFEYFPGILDAHYSGQQQPGYEKMFDHFVMGTTLTKHHAFHEEREIRLVVSPRLTDQSATFYDSSRDSKKIKMIRYRRRGDREIRYIELFGNAPLPIKRIIIGPSKIQNVNYQTICDVTMGSEIDVSKSEIPFLG